MAIDEAIVIQAAQAQSNAAPQTKAIHPPRGLWGVFKYMIELYNRGGSWMLVVQGNSAGVRVFDTTPPKWNPK